MQKSYMPNRNNSKTKISLGEYILAIFCYFIFFISLMLILLSDERSDIAYFGFIAFLGSLAGLAWFNEKVDIKPHQDE